VRSTREGYGELRGCIEARLTGPEDGADIGSYGGSDSGSSSLANSLKILGRVSSNPD